MNIKKYETDAEAFLSEVEKEYYLHFSGQKDSLSLSGIFDRYKYLFDRNNILYFKDLAGKNSGEGRKKFSYLLKFCTECYLEREVKDLVDGMAAEEAEARVNIEGKIVPFRYSEVLLANEEDKTKRDIIEEKRNKIIDKHFNKNLYTYWDTLHGQAKDLGFSSYSDLFSYLKEEDFFELDAGMDRLLSETQLLYEKHFGGLLERELGIKLERSKRSDFAFIKRAKKYDRFFAKDSLTAIFKDTLLGMGIDIQKQGNINLDVEERENKSPRAFCSTVRVPQEIYLVVMPIGGQDDYEAMLHEGGHALHFGNTKADLDFEYRYLGDNAVTEGYAFCLEQLMQNRQWLIDFLRITDAEAKEFVYFSNIVKLWFVRRYAGKLKYELMLHGGEPISSKGKVYKDILSSVNLMEYSEESYLKDVDEGFYCTNYIRAWIFQSQLKEYMHRKFGYEWYRKKKTGDFLRELWSYGQKYSSSEVLSQLDFKKLDPGYLVDSLTEEIKNYKNS